jgi:hypothetical protein
MRSELSRRLWALIAFGVAFAFVEASVVVYLRELLGGELGLSDTGYTELLSLGAIAFVIPDKPILGNDYIGRVETVREFGTLVMLLAVAYLSGASWRQRIAGFGVAFSVWDLLYYGFLRVMDRVAGEPDGRRRLFPHPGPLGGSGANAADRLRAPSGRKHSPVPRGIRRTTRPRSRGGISGALPLIPPLIRNRCGSLHERNGRDGPGRAEAVGAHSQRVTGLRISAIEIERAVVERRLDGPVITGDRAQCPRQAGAHNEAIFDESRRPGGCARIVAGARTRLIATPRVERQATAVGEDRAEVVMDADGHGRCHRPGARYRP